MLCSGDKIKGIIPCSQGILSLKEEVDAQTKNMNYRLTDTGY